MAIEEARQKIVAAYADSFLDNPKVAISLLQKREVNVVVLGGVTNPGQYRLPLFENDIAHAIAAAGGLLEKQTEIQVHRKNRLLATASGQRRLPPLSSQDIPSLSGNASMRPFSPILRIPMRSMQPVPLEDSDVVLQEGDVVIVKKAPDEVFFVVGQLSDRNQVQFSVSNANRDLGNGFLLPRDRDVDVVTAVAMAGYIDPIDSPTTVTVHRTLADGRPLLIRVDLIAARFDRIENVMVQPGDIIYLNPDPAWWIRRTFDRIVPSLFTTPYADLMQRSINPRGFN